MKGRKLGLIVVAMILALAVVGPAYAQDSSIDGYNTESSSIQEDVDSGGTGFTAAGDSGDSGGTGGGSADDGGSLPFTGLDLGLIGIGGAALLATGFGMRRMIRGGQEPA